MQQDELIDRVSEVLAGLDGVGSAFLGGSHGRGEADAYSDVDVYVVVADAEYVSSVLADLTGRLGEVAPILYSKELPNARTINCITVDWLRFDLTVVTAFELPFAAGSGAEPLFDRLGVLANLRAAPESGPQPTTEALLDIVNEFIRVLGLSVVAKGRNDLVVAETGINLLRDMLIRVMVFENAPQPNRGVLALKRALTPAQSAELADLPPLDSTWSSVLHRTEAIARHFFPRARALGEALGATWPRQFERVTLAFVAERLGLAI